MGIEDDDRHRALSYLALAHPAPARLAAAVLALEAEGWTPVTALAALRDQPVLRLVHGGTETSAPQGTAAA